MVPPANRARLLRGKRVYLSTLELVESFAMVWKEEGSPMLTLHLWGGGVSLSIGVECEQAIVC